MYSEISSCAILGVQCQPVGVEVDVSNGLPGFEMVGMPGGEVKEAKERVRVALKNIGYPLPPKKITVNFSPAKFRKNGTVYDLPIAIGILVSMEIIPKEATEGILFMGEISLDGALKFVSGILPGTAMAQRTGKKEVVVPKCNAAEGGCIPGIRVFGFETLPEVIGYLLANEKERRNYKPVRYLPKKGSEGEEDELDYSQVRGQKEAKRAAEIAAAGFHHFFMVGPPGGGKTMIAKRIPTIMPPLTRKESLEVSEIYSINGLLNESHPLILKRPFCAPHHTASDRALIGGGSIPKPGQISLAHKGVLFLDEAPHFSKTAIESLRQPMEEKKIEVSRTNATYIFPADFMLVVAANPCPCGYFPDRNRCRCSAGEIRRYFSRLSGPILDRMDLLVRTSAVKLSDINGGAGNEEAGASIRERVFAARKIQEERYKGRKYSCNGSLGPKEIEEFCILEEDAKALMEKAFHKLKLGARGYHKILKVARTIADLDQSGKITKRHLAEAIGYRMKMQDEEQ